MVFMIIMAVIAALLLVLTNYFSDSEDGNQIGLNLLFTITLSLCLLAIGIEVSARDKEKHGVKSISKPTISYEVTNKVVDGEVVKSDTLYIVRIKREE